MRQKAARCWTPEALNVVCVVVSCWSGTARTSISKTTMEALTSHTVRLSGYEYLGALGTSLNVMEGIYTRISLNNAAGVWVMWASLESQKRTKTLKIAHAL